MDPARAFFRIPATERACADRLATLRWPTGFTCACGSQRHYRIAKRPRVFVCQACSKQTSVTANTVLHRCRKLRNWFLAAARIARDGGVSAAEIQRLTGVHGETAWQMLHRLRTAMEAQGTWSLELVNSALLPVKPPHIRTRYWPGRTYTLVFAAIVGDRILLRMAPFPDLAGDTRKAAPRCGGPAGHPVLWTVLRGVRRQLVRIHQAVSERWMARYLRECQYRLNHLSHMADRSGELLRRVLGQPYLPFADLIRGVTLDHSDDLCGDLQLMTFR